MLLFSADRSIIAALCLSPSNRTIEPNNANSPSPHTPPNIHTTYTYTVGKKPIHGTSMKLKKDVFLNRRRTRGVRGANGPPTFLALKVGVVMYLTS